MLRVACSPARWGVASPLGEGGASEGAHGGIAGRSCRVSGRSPPGPAERATPMASGKRCEEGMSVANSYGTVFRSAMQEAINASSAGNGGSPRLPHFVRCLMPPTRRGWRPPSGRIGAGTAHLGCCCHAHCALRWHHGRAGYVLRHAGGGRDVRHARLGLSVSVPKIDAIAAPNFTAGNQAAWRLQAAGAEIVRQLRSTRRRPPRVPPRNDTPCTVPTPWSPGRTRRSSRSPASRSPTESFVPDGGVKVRRRCPSAGEPR